MTLVQALADTVAKTSFDNLPDDVRESAPSRVLDVIGLCLAALELDTSRATLDWVGEQGGSPQSTAIGLWSGKLPAAQAAFANGVLAHSLDYDDTHLPSILHPSAAVVPAALAVAEASHATGEQLLAAVAIGVEVVVRLGMAGYDASARQSLFFERGQHATSICGAIGAAAAGASLLKLPPKGAADAMGLAVSMAGGVIEANRTGGTVKRLHCGWAAHAGVAAAQLAARGFTGPPTVLEGRFGFYEAYLSGKFDSSAITDGLGESWALADVHYKPYPANHFTHAVADAAIALRARGITSDDIAAVVIGLPTPTVRSVGDPIEVKRRPESGYHAKFSAPYVFASALVGGAGLGLGLDDFSDDKVADPVRRRIMDVTSVEANDECDAAYPYALPAVVTVTTVQGEVVVEAVMVNRGGPGAPLTRHELRAKYTDCASRALHDDDVERLADAVLALPDLMDVAELLEGLS